MNEINNQPTNPSQHPGFCSEYLFPTSFPSLRPDVPPHGGFSANLFAWREAKCIAFDCSLVTPIVTSPLLLIAGLIKRSKLCQTKLTGEHFWSARKAGSSGSKRQNLTAFLDPEQLPRSSEYLGLRQSRWKRSLDRNLSHAQRLRSRWVCE